MRISLRLGSALTICLFGASTVAPIAVQAMPISAAPAKLLPGGPAAIYIRPSPDETRFSLMSRQIGGKTAVVGNVQKTDGAMTLFPSSSQDGRVVVVMQIGHRSAKHILVIRDGRLALDIPINADVTTPLPVVSLDGRRVVYPSSRNTLASLNVETGTATELCPECRFTNVSAGVVSPQWQVRCRCPIIGCGRLPECDLRFGFGANDRASKFGWNGTRQTNMVTR